MTDGRGRGSMCWPMLSQDFDTPPAFLKLHSYRQSKQRLTIMSKFPGPAALATIAATEVVTYSDTLLLMNRLCFLSC